MTADAPGREAPYETHARGGVAAIFASERERSAIAEAFCYGRLTVG